MNFALCSVLRHCRQNSITISLPLALPSSVSQISEFIDRHNFNVALWTVKSISCVTYLCNLTKVVAMASTLLSYCSWHFGQKLQQWTESSISTFLFRWSFNQHMKKCSLTTRHKNLNKYEFEDWSRDNTVWEMWANIVFSIVTLGQNVVSLFLWLLPLARRCIGCKGSRVSFSYLLHPFCISWHFRNISHVHRDGTIISKNVASATEMSPPPNISKSRWRQGNPLKTMHQ